MERAIEGELHAHNQVQHKHLVKFMGDWRFCGYQYIALERCAGALADDRAAYLGMGSTPAGVLKVLRWTGQILEGLGALHAQGLVHRDVKPANILVRHDGDLVVADFGTTTALADNGVVPGGVCCGTPGYISPEVLDMAPCDGRADVWAVG
jgi:serine/threonine protein kinase